jgi:hypothetical protein
MLNLEQSRIAVDLIRKNARIMRRERIKILRHINSLLDAQEAQIPEQLLLPFSSNLRKAIEAIPFDMSSLPIAVASLFNKNQDLSLENLKALKSFCNRIQGEFGAETEDAVLSGDGAALAGLYHDSGAYLAVYWAAVLKDGTCANGERPKALGPPEMEWSEQIQFGNSFWRVPKPALLITLFAAHVGDPTTSPTPPMWPHLGLALLVWKDRIGLKEVLELGGKLAQREEVERGLAIAAHIFPELAKWVNLEELELPVWERKFAVPLAARKLVLGERE